MGAYDVVQELEMLRKQRRFYTTLMVALFLFPILGMLFTMQSSMPFLPHLGFIVTVVGNIFIGMKNGKVTQRYKKLYKENFVVSVLNETFEKVDYNYERGLEEGYVRYFGLTKLGNRYSSEDYLQGIYKGIQFEQADVKIAYKSSGKNSHTTTYFKGRMFAFDFPYKKVQSVQVFSENFPYRGRPAKDYYMKKVEMESAEFNKLFDVQAADEMDAFYVLTPQMMERIEAIRQNHHHMAMHFQDNRLYMGVWTSSDAFDGDVNRPINYVDERESVLRDVQVIIDIIEALDMMVDDSKIMTADMDQENAISNENFAYNSPQEELMARLKDMGFSGLENLKMGNIEF